MAIGDLPPNPPGYDPTAWGQSQWDNGKWNLTDPDGNVWTIHPEDSSHWRHWDKRDKDGKDKGQWPPNPGKPRKGQKKLKSNQCEADPNGDDSPSWEPRGNSPSEFSGGDPSIIFEGGRTSGGGGRLIPELIWAP